PTFILFDEQVPAAAIGNPVAALPDDIEKVYKEARNCTSVGAYTSTVMMARKLIMHIAVERGAAPGQSFAQYVDYLGAESSVPVNGKSWVEKARMNGIVGYHELTINSI